MITASKSTLWEYAWRAYLYWMFQKQFHTLLVAGSTHLKAIDDKKPVLAISNHSNWWDGFVILLLTRLIPHKQHYLMMEEQHLMKYPFFRKLGAFSVNLDNAHSAGISVRYCLRLLQNEKTVIWIFPQGRMLPAKEQLEFRKGASFLASRTKNCVILPLALRYEFLTEQRPIVLARFGEARCCLSHVDASLVTKLLHQIDQDVLKRNFVDYEVFVKPRWSVNKKWEFLWHLLQRKMSDFQKENQYRN